MIEVSSTAKKRIESLRLEEGAVESAALRIAVKRGGCSGFSYKLSFDGNQLPGDQLVEREGLRLVIDQQSLLYLAGMTLDYEGGLNGKGFVFSNPNATKTCGCGTSFAV